MFRAAPAGQTSAVPARSGSRLSRDAACFCSGKSDPDVDNVDLSNYDWINAGKF